MFSNRPNEEFFICAIISAICLLLTYSTYSKISKFLEIVNNVQETELNNENIISTKWLKNYLKDLKERSDHLEFVCLEQRDLLNIDNEE